MLVVALVWKRVVWRERGGWRERAAAKRVGRRAAGTCSARCCSLRRRLGPALWGLGGCWRDGRPRRSEQGSGERAGAPRALRERERERGKKRHRAPLSFLARARRTRPPKRRCAIPNCLPRDRRRAILGLVGRRSRSRARREAGRAPRIFSSPGVALCFSWRVRARARVCSRAGTRGARGMVWMANKE